MVDRYRDPERVNIGRNQFDLLTSAVEHLLNVLVDDWTADVPVAKDPWAGAGSLTKESGTGETWNAIHHARSVLDASRRWDTDG